MRAGAYLAQHATLGHYARELLATQRLRVAQGNRVAAMVREGIPPELVAFARDTHTMLARQERAVNTHLGKLAGRHPLAPWVLAQRGLGLPGFARLVGITGPLDRFSGRRGYERLWAYLGLHVVAGASPKRRRGEVVRYSPAGQVLCYQLGEAIVKMGKGGEYRAVYEQQRAAYLASPRLGPSGCPAGQVHNDKAGTPRPCISGAPGSESSGHVHAMAQRYAAKRLIKRLWQAHRRYVRTGDPLPPVATEAP